jgi:hypothetical protein
MSEGWFYLREGRQQGPVPLEELRRLAAAGELQPVDVAWPEGGAPRPVGELPAAVGGGEEVGGWPAWLDDVRRAEEGRRWPAAAPEELPAWVEDFRRQANIPPAPPRVGPPPLPPAPDPGTAERTAPVPPVLPVLPVAGGPERGPLGLGLLAFGIVFTAASLAVAALLVALRPAPGGPGTREAFRPSEDTTPASPSPASSSAPSRVAFRAEEDAAPDKQGADPGARSIAQGGTAAAKGPAAPPVFSCAEVRRSPEGLGRWRGKRVIVTGKAGTPTTTGLNHRLFWDVPEGVGTVGLREDLNRDQADVACVFRGACPAALEAGKACRIEGTYRGVVATSGVPLLVDCEVARVR